MTMTCPSGNLLDHINMIVSGGHKTVPTLLCGLRGHIPVPTKSVNVGMPTIWQPNKTDTGKRQNTAVRNTEPPRPELGGAVFFGMCAIGDGFGG